MADHVQVGPGRIAVVHRLPLERAEPATGIDRLVCRQPNGATEIVGSRAEILGVANATGQAERRRQGGIGQHHAQIGNGGLFLGLQHVRMLAQGHGQGRICGTGQARQATGGGQAAGLVADGSDIFQVGLGQLPLGGGKSGPGGGKACFGKGDVGAGHLTDFEPVTRGAQFLGDEAHVVLAQRQEFRGATDLEIGIGGAQQHLLFQRQQRLTGGEHGFLGDLDT